MANDANTLIIANSARLLGDAKLLADHGRFASAFALAVLGIEEIGKVADSARCRPPFRSDLAHRSDLISPAISEMISPTIPG